MQHEPENHTAHSSRETGDEKQPMVPRMSGSPLERAFCWMKRLAVATCTVALTILGVACASSQVGDQEQVPTPESAFDLEGTWDWYSSAGVLNSCQLQISREGDRWFGRYVQHPAKEIKCNRLDLRLDRVQVDGARMWLTFKRAFLDEFTELRIQFVATNRFRRYVRWGPSDYFVLVSRTVWK